MQQPPSTHLLREERAREILLRLKRGLAEVPGKDGESRYSAKEFEGDVADFVDAMFPFSVLSGVRIFSAAERMSDMRGFELDNLLHIKEGGVDYIVSIEAKKQMVTVDTDGWMVQYQGKPKCARMQVNRHLKTLWEYLEPLAQGVQLKFVGIVCASDVSQPMTSEGAMGSKLHLCRFDQLTDLLERLFAFQGDPKLPPAEVLRVAQSDFLNILRLSLPVQNLGHPELSNAIRYVDRCRRSLDESLFLEFEPTAERWAINGSAGMGKSVLLAYTAAFLCSGHTLQNLDGKLTVNPSQAILDEIKVPQANGGIAVVIAAMSEKQLQNLKHWYELFVNKFGEAEQVGEVRFSKPEFLLCRDARKLATALSRCDALLVDEAHDLHELAAQQISRSHAERGFYLAVACDRHQKLRLSGADARIIDGVDFQLKSKRLRHIYRNPAPVYLASLAIMFRWCANGGPKVMPSRALLSQSFGIEAELPSSRGYQLSIKSDAHPANSWNHTVATFPSAESAYQALANERMGHREVLWVRFSEEDEDFDYEKLRNFTYHNCRSGEAHLITDKYVKGQEFPVVVIEGFPGFMDRFEDSVTGKADEEKMWQFRREVYLCASRATCFLYFIVRETPPEETTPENARIRDEIKSLVDQCSRATDLHSGGTRTWRMDVRTNGQKRAMAVFDDAIQPDEDEQTFEVEKPAPTEPAASEESHLEHLLPSSAVTRAPETRPVIRPFSAATDGRISAAELAKLLGVQVQDVIRTAKSLGFSNVTAGTALVADLAEKIAARHRTGG
jgi:hypothetical protein